MRDRALKGLDLTAQALQSNNNGRPNAILPVVFSVRHPAAVAGDGQGAAALGAAHSQCRGSPRHPACYNHTYCIAHTLSPTVLTAATGLHSSLRSHAARFTTQEPKSHPMAALHQALSPPEPRRSSHLVSGRKNVTLRHAARQRTCTCSTLPCSPSQQGDEGRSRATGVITNSGEVHRYTIYQQGAKVHSSSTING